MLFSYFSYKIRPGRGRTGAARSVVVAGELYENGDGDAWRPGVGWAGPPGAVGHGLLGGHAQAFFDFLKPGAEGRGVSGGEYGDDVFQSGGRGEDVREEDARGGFGQGVGGDSAGE